MTVEDRIPQHLLNEHDELVSTGYALDAALREFLGRCEALDAELNTRLHPSLGDDRGDLSHDVMDRANGERLALASAMLLRLQHAAIATDRISRWLVDLYGLSGPGLDEHDPQADDRRLMDYVEALVGDDPDRWKQELYRICRNEREYKLASEHGADALSYLNPE